MSEGISAASARLQTALQLAELAQEMHKQNLRRAHPNASDEEIEARFVAWLHARPGAEHGDAWGRPIAWPRSNS